MRHTGERAVAGCTAGLIERGQTVTWRARHLFITQHLTSIITEFNRPFTFADEQVKGAFHSFRHVHRFSTAPDRATLVEDTFTYRAPWGPLGILAERLFLTAYMRRLLHGHQRRLKQCAESDEWRRFIPE